jgi:hypothetical protein
VLEEQNELLLSFQDEFPTRSRDFSPTQVPELRWVHAAQQTDGEDCGKFEC